MGTKSKKKTKIGNWSFIYFFVKNIWVGPYYRVWYRKQEIVGLENIPKNRPVILAGNHQNALMDALAVLFAKGFQPVFVARADIFKNPVLRAILTSFKIMPIFRIRDGAKNLKNNDETFDNAVTILSEHKSPFAIMPEGNHGDKRRLRPLQKGIFRIAMKAQENYGTQNGVCIVPVGIDYSDYQKPFSRLFVKFGKPIELAPFHEKYQENQATTTNEMRDELAKRMKEEMISIDSKENYETIYDAKEIYTPYFLKQQKIKNTRLNKFKKDKEVIAKLEETEISKPEILNSLKENIDEFKQAKAKLNISPKFIKPNGNLFFGIIYRLLMACMGLPIFLYGLTINFIPYKLPLLFMKGIKDPQFVSSFRMVLWWLISTVFFIVYAILAFKLLPYLWLKILVVATFVRAGQLARFYWNEIEILGQQIKIFWLQMIKNEKLQHLVATKQQVINKIDGIVNN